MKEGEIQDQQTLLHEAERSSFQLLQNIFPKSIAFNFVRQKEIPVSKVKLQSQGFDLWGDTVSMSN